MSAKKVFAIISLLFIFSTTQGFAGERGIPWLDQASPFDFIFGNHIDTHQQSMVLPNKELMGYLYVEYTGEYTPEGYPIAKHSDCYSSDVACVAAWRFRGVPGQAIFLYHSGSEHPVWMVASRNDIPQPGGFSHFHWLDGSENAKDLMRMTYDGYFLELTALKKFAFMHGGEKILVTPGLDLATHLNIVTSDLTSGGGGDGGHDH